MKFIRDNIKIITAFIMGMIISGFTVYAVTISSVNVEYDNSKSGLTSNNVEEAINELYGSASKKMAINTFGEAMYAESMGKKTNGRGTSLNLTKGKYIITASNEYAGGNTSITNTAYYQDSGLNPSCSNCNIVFLSGRHKNCKGNSHNSDDIIMNFFVEVFGENDTFSIYYTTSNESSVAHAVGLQAIPINQ